MADTTYVYQILGDSPANPGNTTLNLSDLEAVRGALGLTSSEVPDELVHENTHGPAAEMEILSSFSAAGSQTGNNLILVKTACRLLIASKLADHMAARIAQQERIEGAINTVNFRVDWAEVAKNLYREAYNSLGKIQAYVDELYGSGTAKEDIPGLPMARANGLSRAQIATKTYPGFWVK